MHQRTVAVLLSFVVCGCVPSVDADLVETSAFDQPEVIKAVPAQKARMPKPVGAGDKVAKRLAGGWTLLLDGGARQCAVQLKPVQFGGNQLAGSVCDGNPNIWGWRVRGDTLELFDHTNAKVAVLSSSGPAEWAGERVDETPAEIVMQR